MGIRGGLKKIQEVFSSGFSLRDNIKPVSTSTANVTSNDYTKFLLGMTSDWITIPEEEIFTQMYIWESEVGSAVDKIGTMVGQAFMGFDFIDPDEIYLPSGDKPEVDILVDMKNAANYLRILYDVDEIVRVYGELIQLFGNFYVWEDPDILKLYILPNQKVTLLDNLDRISGNSEDLENMTITECNYIVVDEGVPNLQKVYPIDECYIVRIRDTPIYVNDRFGRKTYGLYATSPCQRAIIPVWNSRIIKSIDSMWRWANVPVDHHKLSSLMYSLDKFPIGDMDERMASASAAAELDCTNYANNIASKTPDQHIITTDGVEIVPIEHSTAGYMQPNDLLEQINTQIWSAMNIPKFVVTGTSDSSYASELLISNYMEAKIVEITRKVMKPILENTRKRLALLYPGKNFPVDYLQTNVDFALAATEIDKVKKSVAMAGGEIYTYDECRKPTGHSTLKPDQYNKIVRKGRDIEPDGTYKVGENESIYPDTSTSRNQRPTSPGMSKAEKSTKV